MSVQRAAAKMTKGKYNWVHKVFSVILMTHLPVSILVNEVSGNFTTEQSSKGILDNLYSTGLSSTPMKQESATTKDWDLTSSVTETTPKISTMVISDVAYTSMNNPSSSTATLISQSDTTDVESSDVKNLTKPSDSAIATASHQSAKSSMDTPTHSSTTETSDPTSFISTSSKSHITAAILTQSTTQDSMKMFSSKTMAGFSESSSPDRKVVTTSNSFRLTGGTENTYSQTPINKSGYTALDVKNAKFTEFSTENSTFPLPTATSDTGETTSKTETLTSMAVTKESPTLSTMSTDFSKIGWEVGTTNLETNEGQTNNRETTTYFSTKETTDHDSTSRNNFASSVSTLISQSATTLAESLHVEKSTDALKYTIQNLSEKSMRDSSDFPVSFSTTETPVSMLFSFPSSNSHITTWSKSKSNTVEAIEPISSVTERSFSESSPTADQKISTTLPSYHSTDGIETTFSQEPETTTSTYTVLPIVTATTANLNQLTAEKSTLSLPASTFVTEQTTSQRATLTSITNKLQESTPLSATPNHLPYMNVKFSTTNKEEQKEARLTTEFSKKDTTDPSSCMSTKTNDYIPTDAVMMSSTAETVNRGLSETTADFSGSVSTNKVIITPSLSSSGGTETTFNQVLTTTTSDYTASPITIATTATSTEFTTATSLPATTSSTGESTALTEPLPSMTVSLPSALSFTPTEFPDTRRLVSTANTVSTESRSETRRTTDYSIMLTSDFDSKLTDNAPSAMTTLIHQLGKTLAGPTDLEKSTKTTEDIMPTLSDKNNTGSSGLSAIFSTTELSDSRIFSSARSDSHISSTLETVKRLSSITPAGLTESPSTAGDIIFTSPSSSSPHNLDTTYNFIPGNTTSNYTPLPIVKTSTVPFAELTEESTFSTPSTTFGIVQPTSQKESLTSVAVTNAVQQSSTVSAMKTFLPEKSVKFSTLNTVITDGQKETRMTTEFSTKQPTVLLSTIPPLLSKSTGSHIIISDPEISAETSVGATTTFVDKITNHYSDFPTTHSTNGRSDHTFFSSTRPYSHITAGSVMMSNTAKTVNKGSLETTVFSDSSSTSKELITPSPSLRSTGGTETTYNQVPMSTTSEFTASPIRIPTITTSTEFTMAAALSSIPTDLSDIRRLVSSLSPVTTEGQSTTRRTTDNSTVLTSDTEFQSTDNALSTMTTLIYQSKSTLTGPTELEKSTEASEDIMPTSSDKNNTGSSDLLAIFSTTESSDSSSLISSRSDSSMTSGISTLLSTAETVAMSSVGTAGLTKSSSSTDQIKFTSPSLSPTEGLETTYSHIRETTKSDSSAHPIVKASTATLAELTEKSTFSTPSTTFAIAQPTSQKESLTSVAVTNAVQQSSTVSAMQTFLPEKSVKFSTVNTVITDGQKETRMTAEFSTKRPTVLSSTMPPPLSKSTVTQIIISDPEISTETSVGATTTFLDKITNHYSDFPATPSTNGRSDHTSLSSTRPYSHITSGAAMMSSTAKTVNKGSLETTTTSTNEEIITSSPSLRSSVGTETTYNQVPLTTTSEFTASPIRIPTITTSTEFTMATALSSIPTDLSDIRRTVSTLNPITTERQPTTRRTTDYSTVLTPDTDFKSTDNSLSTMTKLIYQSISTLTGPTDLEKSTETSEDIIPTSSDKNNTGSSDLPAIFSTTESSDSSSFISSRSDSSMTSGILTLLSTAETVAMSSVGTAGLTKSSSSTDQIKFTSPSLGPTEGLETTYSHIRETTESDSSAHPIVKASTATLAELTEESTFSTPSTTFAIAQPTSQKESLTSVAVTNAVQQSSTVSAMQTFLPEKSVKFSTLNTVITDGQKETRMTTEFSTKQPTVLLSTIPPPLSKSTGTHIIISDPEISAETSVSATTTFVDKITNHYSDFPTTHSTNGRSTHTFFSSTRPYSHITAGSVMMSNTAKTVNKGSLETTVFSDSSSTSKELITPSPSLRSTGGTETTYNQVPMSTTSEFTASPIRIPTITTSTEFTMAAALSSIPTDLSDIRRLVSSFSPVTTEGQSTTRRTTDYSTVLTSDTDFQSTDNALSTMKTLIYQSKSTLTGPTDLEKSTEASEDIMPTSSDKNNTGSSDLLAIFSTTESSDSSSFISSKSDSSMTSGISTLLSTAETVAMSSVGTAGLTKSSSSTDQIKFTSPSLSPTEGLETTYSHIRETTKSDSSAHPIVKASTATLAELIEKSTFSTPSTTFAIAQPTSQKESLTSVAVTNAVQQSSTVSAMQTFLPEKSVKFSTVNTVITDGQKETRMTAEFSTKRPTVLSSTMPPPLSKSTVTQIIISDPEISTETSVGATTTFLDKITNHYSDFPTTPSTNGRSDHTSFSSTRPYSHITSGAAMMSSTAKTVNKGSLETTTTSTNEEIITSSPSLRSSVGTETTYNQVPLTTTSEFTASPIRIPTITTSTEFTMATALSSIPTDLSDIRRTVSTLNPITTERQPTTRRTTDYSTVLTPDTDFQSTDNSLSTMTKLIYQSISTLTGPTDPEKSTETSEDIIPTSSDKNNTGSSDLPAIFSTTESSDSSSFISSRSDSSMTSGILTLLSTAETVAISSIGTTALTKSLSSTNQIKFTSPSLSPTEGLETTYSHIRETTKSDSSAHAIVKASTEEPIFSLPSTTFTTAPTSSRKESSTSVLTSALDSTSANNPSSGRSTVVPDSAAALAKTTDQQKATETSEGTTSTLSNKSTKRASLTSVGISNTEQESKTESSMLTDLPNASLQFSTHISAATDGKLKRRITTDFSTMEISPAVETMTMFPSVSTGDILAQYSTVKTTSHKEPMISLTSSNTVNPSSPVVSTTSLHSATQPNITSQQTTKLKPPTPQVIRNSTSYFSSLETGLTRHTTNFTFPLEATSPSADFIINSQSSSAVSLSASSHTSVNSKVNVTKQPTLTSTLGNVILMTEQTSKSTVLSSASGHTKMGPSVATPKTKRSLTTAVDTSTLMTISRIITDKPASRTAATTKGTTRAPFTSARVTTKKITAASTALCVGSRVTNIRIEKIDSKEISVSWSGNNLRPQMKYTVKLNLDSNTSVAVNESTETKAQFTDLLPGQTYTLTIEYVSCRNMEEFLINITTAADIYESSTRIPGIVFLPEYRNHSSPQFQTLATHFREEVTKNLPKNFQDLIKANDLRVIVTSIRKGSVIIGFDLVLNVGIDLQTSTVERNIINALNTSSLDVDLNQTTFREADACERGTHQCSENGTCKKVGPSHICSCKAGFMDQNPSFPGINCQKNALTTISPTFHQSTRGKDLCEGTCSSLAECTVIASGTYGCQCYHGLIDDNLSNPGKLCRDPFDCFSEEKKLCSPSNMCLRSKSVCSRKNLFKATVELKSWQFTPALYNTESEDWINVSTNFTITVISKMRSFLMDESFDLSVMGFKRGSVVVRVVFGFNGGSLLNVPTIETAVQDVIRANLDKFASVTLEELPVEENSEGGWRVATIILGVLLGAVLLAIAVTGFTFALRRRLDSYKLYKIQQKNNGRQKAVPMGTSGSYLCQDV